MHNNIAETNARKQREYMSVMWHTLFEKWLVVASPDSEKGQEDYEDEEYENESREPTENDIAFMSTEIVRESGLTLGPYLGRNISLDGHPAILRRISAYRREASLQEASLQEASLQEATLYEFLQQKDTPGLAGDI